MRLFEMVSDAGFERSRLLAGPNYRLSGMSLGTEYFGWSKVKINIFESPTYFQQTYTPSSSMIHLEHLCTSVTLEFFVRSYFLHTEREDKWVEYLKQNNIQHTSSRDGNCIKITIDDPRYLVNVAPACYANGVEFILCNNDFNKKAQQIEYEWRK